MIKLAVVLRILLAENQGNGGWGCREIETRQLISERRSVGWGDAQGKGVGVLRESIMPCPKRDGQGLQEEAAGGKILSKPLLFHLQDH